VSDNDLSKTVERVLESVREAASEPLHAGAAELTTSSVRNLYGYEGMGRDLPP
jgi:hypothetical protein